MSFICKWHAWPFLSVLVKFAEKLFESAAADMENNLIGNAGARVTFGRVIFVMPVVEDTCKVFVPVKLP